MTSQTDLFFAGACFVVAGLLRPWGGSILDVCDLPWKQWGRDRRSLVLMFILLLMCLGFDRGAQAFGAQFSMSLWVGLMLLSLGLCGEKEWWVLVGLISLLWVIGLILFLPLFNPTEFLVVMGGFGLLEIQYQLYRLCFRREQSESPADKEAAKDAHVILTDLH